MKKTPTAKVTPASQKKSGLYNKLNEEKDEDDKAAQEARDKRLAAKYLKNTKFKIRFTSLPSPFALIDYCVSVVKGYFTNSFKVFLTRFFTAIPRSHRAVTQGSIAITDMKEMYEKFCFLKNLREREIDYARFTQYGFSVKKTRSTGEVFKNLRFVSPSDDILECDSFDSNILSLQHFLNTECLITQFEDDVISSSVFKKKYKHFCQQHRLKEVPVSKAMLASYGIQTAKENETYVQRTPLNVSAEQLKQRGFEALKKRESLRNCCYRFWCCCSRPPSQSYKIDIRRMQQQLDLLALNFIHQYCECKAKPTVYTRLWCLYDFLSVVLHVIAVLFLSVFPLILSYFYEVEYGYYQSRDSYYIVELQDFWVSPWIVPFKIPTMASWNIVLFAVSATYFAFSLVELIVYYADFDFPISTLRRFNPALQNKNKNCCQKTLTTIQWIYIIVVLGQLVGYVVLVLIWALLGAILNPQGYLAYATAAGTLVSFSVIKIRQFQKLQKEGIQNLMKVLQAQFKARINVFLEKMIKKTDEISPDVEGVLQAGYQFAKGSNQEKIASVLALTPLGQKIAEEGYDIKILIKIAMGDKQAIYTFASNHGIPQAAAQALIALLSRNMHQVQSALKKLASHPALNMPGELIDTLACVVFDSSSSLQSLNQLTLYVFDILENRLPQADRNEQLKAVKGVFPLIFQSILSLSSMDLDAVIHTFQHINSSLNQVILKKQAHSELLSKSAVPKSSSFFIPPSYISVLELVRIPISLVSGVPLNLQRIEKAVFTLAEQLLGGDSSLLEFFSLVFTKQPRAQVEKGIRKVSKSLKIPPIMLNLALQFAHTNDCFSEEFFAEIAALLNSYVLKDFKISKKMIQLCFGVSSLLSSTELNSEIVKEASILGIEVKTIAQILNNPNRHSWWHLLSKDLRKKIAKSLHLSVDELSGLIALLGGEYNSPNLMKILFHFCQMHHLSPDLVKLIKHLLIISGSSNSKEVLDAIKYLKIKHAHFVLLGKGLILPKNIETEQLLKLGIPSNSPVILERERDNKRSQEQWLEMLKNELLGITPKLRKPSHRNEVSIIEEQSETFIHSLGSTTQGYIKLQGQSRASNQNQKSPTAQISQVVDFLNIQKKQLSQDTLKYLGQYKLEQKEVEIIHLLLSVTDRGDTSLAFYNLSRALGYNSKLLRSVHDLVTGKWQPEAKIVNSLASKIQKSKTLKSITASLSTFLGVPQFLFNLLLGEAHFSDLSIQDVYLIFDLLKVHIPSEVKLGLGSLISGSVSSFLDLLKELPKSLNELLTALQSGDMNQIIQATSDLDFKGTRIPKKMITTLLCILSFLKGQASTTFFTDYEQSAKINGYEFLGKQFHIAPQFFMAVESMLKGNVKELPSLLQSTIQSAYESGFHLIDPSLVKGIFSLVRGKIDHIEEFATKLNLAPQLVETCILLARINSKNNKKYLNELTASNAFSLFCDKLYLDSSKFASILKLSFTDCSSPSQILSTLGVEKHYDLKIIEAFFSICKESLKREQGLNSLQTRIKRITEPLGIDQELAVIGVRLSQGDWKILDNYKTYLMPLLPSDQVRNIAKSVCGILRSQITFTNSKNQRSEFQQATELFSEIFNISPLVFRLAALDPQLLRFIEKKYDVPKQCVIGFIVTISKIPQRLVNYILERDLQKRYARESEQEKIEEKGGAFEGNIPYKNGMDLECQKFLKGEEVDHRAWSQDYFETILFNEPRYTTFQYEDVASQNSIFPEGQAKDIIGEKGEWQEKIAHAVGQRSWLRERDRAFAKNTWVIFKELLAKLSEDNGSDYESISVSQLIFALTLVKMRRSVEHTGWSCTKEQYSLLLLNLDMATSFIEIYGQLRGHVNSVFDKMSLIKLIGMTLNVKISNIVGQSLMPSVFKVHTLFKEKYEKYFSNRQPQTKARQYFSLLEQNQILVPYKWKEVRHLLDHPNDSETALDCFGWCDPYEEDEVFNWKPRSGFYDAQFKLREDESEKQKILRSKLMVRRQADHTDLLEEDNQGDFFANLERQTVADSEGFDFIMGLANSEDEVWRKHESMLHDAQLVVKDICGYQSITSLIHLPRSMQRYLKRSPQNPNLPSPDIKELLKLAHIRDIDFDLVAHLLQIAHGNFRIRHFTELASCFSVSQELITTFFYSVLRFDSDARPLIKILQPLAIRLQIPVKLLKGMISILRGEKEGWITLVQELALKLNSPVILVVEQVLNLIDWEQLSLAEDKAELDFLSFLPSTHTSSLTNIMNGLLKVWNTSLTHNEESTILNILKIVLLILKKDSNEQSILFTISEVFRIQNKSTLEALKAVISLIRHKETANLRKILSTFIDLKCQTLNQPEIKIKLEAALNIMFGIVSKDNTIIDKGVRGIGGSLENAVNMIRILAKITSLKGSSLSDFMKSEYSDVALDTVTALVGSILQYIQNPQEILRDPILPSQVSMSGERVYQFLELSDQEMIANLKAGQASLQLRFENKLEECIHAVILQDFRRFLAVLSSEDQNSIWQKSASLILSLYDLIKMKEEDFANSAQLFDNFGQSMAQFMRSIQVNPKLLGCLVKLIMAIRLTKIDQTIITDLIYQIVEQVLAKTGNVRDVRKEFNMIVSSITGKKDPKSKEKLQTAQRIQLFLEAAVDIFVPSFQEYLPILELLLRIIDSLFKRKNYTQVLARVQNSIEDIGDLFGVSPSIVSGIIGILNLDFEEFGKMIAPIAHVDVGTITKIMSYVNELVWALQEHYRRNQALKRKIQKVNDQSDIMAKIEQGTASASELFEVVNTDKKGGISKTEFKAMLQRLDIIVSENRVNQIYASAQHNVSGQNDDNPDELNEAEFEEAVNYLQAKKSQLGLQILKLSTCQLVLAFVFLLTLLLLLFLFIFIGIKAFSIGGTLGSIVNSVLPVIAGIGVGWKKSVDREQKKEKAKKAAEKADQIIHNSKK